LKKKLKNEILESSIGIDDISHLTQSIANKCGNNNNTNTAHVSLPKSTGTMPTAITISAGS
jgi:hypothetical protein